jgi:WD40 repeat protein
MLPYIGLRPFNESDQRLFFGREEQINAVLTLLEDDAFLAIVGSSGSGKSSLVRAGLIPLVREGFLLGCTHWQVAIAKPGNRPFEALAAAMANSAASSSDGELDANALSQQLLEILRTESQALQTAHRDCGYDEEAGLLLVVDQFEELFAYRRGDATDRDASQRDEGAAFVRMLLRGAADRQRLVRVLITMRSDFIGDCEAFLGLPEVISRSQFLVPRLDRVQMEAVISGPSILNGDGQTPFAFEAGLVNRVINDAGDRPDQLPLLQHALMQTWKFAVRRTESRSGLLLTFADYEKAGGIQEALSRDADAALAELTDERQLALARRLFLLLCDVSSQGQLTRRRPSLADVESYTGADRADIRAVARVFQKDDRNFLLPPADDLDADAVLLDISHESLLRRWGRFQDWLGEEDKDATELRDWLRRARQRQGRDGVNCLSEADTALASQWRQRVNDRGQASRWALRYTGPGSYEEVDTYIQSSRKHLAKSKKEQRKNKAEKDELRREALAERDRRLVEAQQAAGVIRRKSRFISFVALAAVVLGVFALFFQFEARKLAKEARAGELAVTADNLRHDQPELSALLALEARRLDPRSPLANALLRSAVATERPRITFRGHEGAVTSARFSADGKRIVTASVDGTARLWDVASGKALPVLRGHAGAVNDARFSADSQRVLTAGPDNSARLWEVASGKLKNPPFKVDEIPAHSDEQSQNEWSATFKSAQLSRDDKTVLTVNSRESGIPNFPDVTARLWDVHSGKQRAVLGDLEASIIDAQFSADGKSVLTTARDNKARLWNTASGGQQSVLGGDKAPIFAAVMSRDGMTLLTRSRDDGTIWLWDTATGNQRVALRGHEGQVNDVQFSDDGRKALTAGHDGTVRLWNLPAGNETQTFLHADPVDAAVLSHNGKIVLTRDRLGKIRLWDVDTGQIQKNLGGPESVFIDAQFSPSDQSVLTVSKDNSLGLWDSAGVNVPTVLAGHTQTVTSTQFSADGRTVLTKSLDGTARLWNLTCQRLVLGHAEAATQAPAAHPDPAGCKPPVRGHTDAEAGVVSAQLSADGKTVITTSDQGIARLWDAVSGDQIRVFGGANGRVVDAQFGLNDQLVMTINDEKVAHLWKTATGMLLNTFGGTDHLVIEARFSPDGHTVVTVGADKSIKLWDAETDQQGAVYTSTEDEIKSCRLSPDGMTVVFFGTAEKAWLWDIKTPKPRPLIGHHGTVTAVRFSADGKKVLTASADTTARVWDARTGQLLKSLRGHQRSITSAEFSPDGKSVLTSSDDKTARIWDVESGIELEVLAGHGGKVLNAQFSHDGETIVTASDDGTARLWPCRVCQVPKDLAHMAETWVDRPLTDVERAQYGLQ